MEYKYIFATKIKIVNAHKRECQDYKTMKTRFFFDLFKGRFFGFNVETKNIWSKRLSKENLKISE